MCQSNIYHLDLSINRTGFKPIWNVGGSRGCARDPRVQILSFHAVLAKKLQNNRLAHILWELAPPTSGKSWIRHCERKDRSRQGSHISTLIVELFSMICEFSLENTGCKAEQMNIRRCVNSQTFHLRITCTKKRKKKQIAQNEWTIISHLLFTNGCRTITGKKRVNNSKPHLHSIASMIIPSKNMKQRTARNIAIFLCDGLTGASGGNLGFSEA